MALQRKLMDFLLIPLIWILLLVNSLNCREICLAETTYRSGTNCAFTGFSLNYNETLAAKKLFLDNFCYRSNLVKRQFLISTESTIKRFDDFISDDFTCSDLYDSLSGLLYWAPLKNIKDYFQLFDSYEYDNGRSIIRDNIDDTKYNVKIVSNNGYLLGTPEIETTQVMIIRRPTHYALKNTETTKEIKIPQEIVDLGTFSLYNPTEDFQDITLQVNLTDNLIIYPNKFVLFNGANLEVTENKNIWRGDVELELEWNNMGQKLKYSPFQRIHLKKITLNSLPPKTSVTGRLFATLILTRSPFVATVSADGVNFTDNLGGRVTGEFLKYENTNLRLEGIKMSPHERQIFFASYIACLVGLGTALIMGFAIFLICIVAQKKKKECICPHCNFNLNKKRQFIAQKARSIGRVLQSVGNICGNICSCIGRQIV